MQDFRNLKVWEKGHALTMATYKETADFPNHELFGLRLHKCAVRPRQSP